MSTKKKVLSLFACCLVNVCLGSIYSWSVFSQGMVDYLNATAGLSLSYSDLSIIYTVANLIGPLTMIFGGRINDLFGPKYVIMAGGILYGGGMVASGFAGSVGFLIVSYGVIGGFGLGLAYGSVISTAVKLFPEKKGLMGGLTTASYGISSVIMPPVISAVMGATDAPFTFKTIGVVFLVLIVLSSLFIRNDRAAAGSQAAGRLSENEMDWKQMLRQPVFYAMFLLLICGAFSGMMVISQAAQIGINTIGLTAAQAAFIVSLLALFNTAGRIVAGTLSDRIGRIGTLKLACALSAVAEVCLLFSGAEGAALFYIGISIAGISFGSFMGVYPGFTSDRFGLRNNGVNYGIMCIGFALAGLLGPMIAKNTFNSTGSFSNAFLFACIFSVAGFVLTFICQLIINRRKESSDK